MASSTSIFSLALLLTITITITITISEAKEFLVGGLTNGWKVPSSPSDSLNKWAESSRFQVDDSLVWKYDAKKDSVLQVTRKDYLSCNMSSPIAAHDDGHTVVRLHRPGGYYFVGGARGACEKGEKLIVVVMSPRWRNSAGPAPSPAPVMFAEDGPAVAPTSGGPVEVVVSWGLVAVIGMMFGVVVF